MSRFIVWWYAMRLALKERLPRQKIADSKLIDQNYCCTVCIVVLDAKRIDQSWSTYSLRYSKVTPANRTASAKTPTAATKVTAAARSRGRLHTTTAKPTGGKRTLSTLGDQVLALATGKTQQEIAAACKGARPNHVGMALARHKRAGRIEEREGKLYVTQSVGAEQHAAV